MAGVGSLAVVNDVVIVIVAVSVAVGLKSIYKCCPVRIPQFVGVLFKSDDAITI